MSEMEVGVISGVVGALAGGVTGFIASRINTYLDNRGKITIKPFNHRLLYHGVTEEGFDTRTKAFSGVQEIILRFSLELRNTAKIRKDYKNAKLIIRTYELVDEATLLYDDDENGFQHGMMDPLECKIMKIKSRIRPYELNHLQGKTVEFYVTITDSKDVITEVLICTEENFLHG